MYILYYNIITTIPVRSAWYIPTLHSRMFILLYNYNKNIGTMYGYTIHTHKLEIRKTTVSRPFVNYSNRILFRVITVAATTMTALHTCVRLRLQYRYRYLYHGYTCSYLRWLCLRHIILCYYKHTQVGTIIFA